jgi:hypothetical protein
MPLLLARLNCIRPPNLFLVRCGRALRVKGDAGHFSELLRQPSSETISGEFSFFQSVVGKILAGVREILTGNSVDRPYTRRCRSITKL